MIVDRLIIRTPFFTIRVFNPLDSSNVPPLLTQFTKSMNAKRGEDMNSEYEKLRMAASPLLFSTPWEVMIADKLHIAQSFGWYDAGCAFPYFARPLLV